MKQLNTLIDYSTLEGQMVGRAAVTEAYWERMDELKAQIDSFCALVDNAYNGSDRTRGELLAAMQEMGYHLDHATKQARNYKTVTKQQLLLSDADKSDYAFIKAIDEQLPEACRKALEMLGDKHLQTEYCHLSLEQLAEKLEEAKDDIEAALPIQIKLFRQLYQSLLSDHYNMDNATKERIFNEQFTTYGRDHAAEIEDYFSYVIDPNEEIARIDHLFETTPAVAIWMAKRSASTVVNEMRADTGLPDGEHYVEKDLQSVYEYKHKRGRLNIMAKQYKINSMEYSKYKNCNIGQVIESGGNATMHVHMGEEKKQPHYDKAEVVEDEDEDEDEGVCPITLTDEQQAAFDRAAEANFIKPLGNGKYRLLGQKVSLAYFIGRLFCKDYVDSKYKTWKRVGDFPSNAIEAMFGEKNIASYRSNRKDGNPPRDYKTIDGFIEG